MSIILVLLLLFLSLRSCNARLLVVARNHPANEFQHSITKGNGERLNDFPTEVARKTLAESEEKRVKNEDEDDETASASDKMWRVPHKKRGGEEAAGFNLDYLPPRTHPPVHN